MKIPEEMDSRWSRLLMGLLCCVLAAVPFLLVRFPPITDLPQHVAQVRLFVEAFGHPGSPYKIQWMTPYSSVYALLGACWLIFGPRNAGRFGMLVIAMVWIGLLHFLAWRKQRPVPAATLASILFFSRTLYWGFYQFALGGAAFMIWILLVDWNFKSRFLEVSAFFLASLALYYTHILWFLAAVGWLAGSHLFGKKDWRSLLWRSSAAVPFLILGAAWYPSLAAYGFQSRTTWVTTPFERLSPRWIVDAAFGGLKGPVEPIFFGLIVLWLLVGGWQRRKEMAFRLDKELLFLGASFLLLALFLPDRHTNTIRLAARWMPSAVAFLLLALPQPRLRRGLLDVLAIGAAAAFFFVTSSCWMNFEKSEMSGLQESLAALPRAPRVLGLSYVRFSAIVRGQPFIQTFAYSQVWNGGELNFSFADFGPSLVLYRKRRQTPWTSGLEWSPERARGSDLAFFDYVLVNGDEHLHATFGRDLGLRPVTLRGRWRLYQTPESSP